MPAEASWLSNLVLLRQRPLSVSCGWSFEPKGGSLSGTHENPGQVLPGFLVKPKMQCCEVAPSKAVWGLSISFYFVKQQGLYLHVWCSNIVPDNQLSAESTDSIMRA